MLTTIAIKIVVDIFKMIEYAVFNRENNPFKTPSKTMFNLNANVSEMSVPTLQSIVRENNIPCQDKRRREFLESSVSAWQEVQKEVIAMAVDAERVAAESSEAIEAAVLSVGSLTVAALTSEAAIGFYRGVLKFAVFAIVITYMFAIALLKWCWEHRSDMAVYHWIMNTLDSSHGRSALTQLLIFEWVVAQWIESVGEVRDRIISQVQAVSDSGLVRLGLGGVVIEVP